MIILIEVSEYDQIVVTDASDNFHYQIVQVINLHDQIYYQITDTMSFKYATHCKIMDDRLMHLSGGCR